MEIIGVNRMYSTNLHAVVAYQQQEKDLPR